MLGRDQEQSRRECGGSRHRAASQSGVDRSGRSRSAQPRLGCAVAMSPRTPSGRHLPSAVSHLHLHSLWGRQSATVLRQTRWRPQCSKGDRPLAEACAPETTGCSQTRSDVETLRPKQ